MKLNYKLIESVKLENVRMSGFPDFFDAYVVSARYDGRDMTEEELECLNEDNNFISEEAINLIYLEKGN